MTLETVSNFMIIFGAIFVLRFNSLFLFPSGKKRVEDIYQKEKNDSLNAHEKGTYVWYKSYEVITKIAIIILIIGILLRLLDFLVSKH